MNRRDLIDALKAEDFSPYYRLADKIRFQEKGNYVDIRAILEFSNICRRKCVYCGLNCRNQALHRYRMTPDEIVDAASAAARAGYRTLVMQSGEDPWFTPKILGGLVKEIKKTGMAVTLSCGEMPKEAYAYLRECGADRYLLKHETADPEIYSALHPDSSLQQRIACLKVLKRLGYETGSGFMIGLPGRNSGNPGRRPSPASGDWLRYGRHGTLYSPSRHAFARAFQRQHRNHQTGCGSRPHPASQAEPSRYHFSWRSERQ